MGVQRPLARCRSLASVRTCRGTEAWAVGHDNRPGVGPRPAATAAAAPSAAMCAARQAISSDGSTGAGAAAGVRQRTEASTAGLEVHSKSSQ